MFPGRSRLLFLICLALAGASRAEAPPDAQPRLDSYGDPLPPGAVARLGTIRLRPGAWVADLISSPDGKTLLHSDDGGVVRFWDAATGKPLQPLAVGEGWLVTITLSPDGKTLAAGGSQGISLWNLEKREQIGKLKAGSEGVRSLAFTPDGKTLVSGAPVFDGAIRVWDLATGKERRRMMWHDRREVTRVLVAPDGGTLISVSSGGRRVHFADLNTGEEIRTITERNWDALGDALLTPDGKSLVLRGSRKVDRGIKGVHIEAFLDIYDPATGKRVRALEGFDRSITGAALAPDGNTLISSDFDSDFVGTIRVWDLAAGKELRKWNAQGTVCLISPDGKTVVSVGGAIRLWDLATGKSLHDYEAHEGVVMWLAFAPDGKTLASSSSEVRLWDLTKGRQLRVLSGHEGDRGAVRSIGPVCFLPDGGGIISGASDSTLRLWDPATGKEVRRFQLPGRQPVISMGLSADGKRLLCASSGFGEKEGHMLTVFEVASGKELVRREEKRDRRAGEIFSTFHPVFSPDGKVFAQNGGDVLLREVDTGKEVQRLKGPGILDVLEWPFVFAPDSKWMAVYSITKSSGSPLNPDVHKVRLFEVATGKEKQAFAAEGEVRRLAFSPGGELLAVAGTKTVRVWDLAAGKKRWTSPALDSDVWSLAFAPDGKTLATGLGNSSILLWDVTQSPAK